MTSIAVAIDVDSSRVFTIENINYRFPQNMSFNSMQVNNSSLMLNDVWINIEAEGLVNVTINNFVDDENFNISYNATMLGPVSFSIGKVIFLREYEGGEDLVVWELNVENETSSLIDSLDAYDEFGFFFDIFPFVIMVMAAGMIMFAVMGRFGRRGMF